MPRITHRTRYASPTTKALAKVMQLLLKDDTQVYKQFVENESFKRSVSDLVYTITGLGTAGNGHVQP